MFFFPLRKIDENNNKKNYTENENEQKNLVLVTTFLDYKIFTIKKSNLQTNSIYSQYPTIFFSKDTPSVSSYKDNGFINEGEHNIEPN